MPDQTPGDVTQLLPMGDGGRSALDRMMPLVYDELRQNHQHGCWIAPWRYLRSARSN